MVMYYAECTMSTQSKKGLLNYGIQTMSIILEIDKFYSVGVGTEHKPSSLSNLALPPLLMFDGS